MTKNTNLRIAREKLGWSQAELVRRVREQSGGGFTQQSLSKLERNPEAESKYWIYIQQVLARAGIYLNLDGEDEDAVREQRGGYAADCMRVPVIGEAGFGEDGECPALEHAREPARELAWPGRDAGAYALRIRGDALRPRLKHGELLVLEPAREPAPGDEVLIKTEQRRFSIREYLYERDGRLYFHSLNQHAGQGITSLPREELGRLDCVAGIVKDPTA